MTDPTPDHPHEDLTAPPPPDGVLDAARAAALEAFDTERADDGPAAPAAVGDLDRRRERRSAWARLPLGAVAAALVLVALVGVLVTQVDLEASDGDDSATASLDDVAEEDESFEEAGGDVGEAADDGAGADDSASFETDRSAPPAPRRAYADLDAFVADVRDGTTGPTAGDSTEDGDAPASTTTALAVGCDPVTAAGVAPDSVRRLVPATVAGDRVVGVVYAPEGASAGTERVAVVDESSCSLLDDRAL